MAGSINISREIDLNIKKLQTRMDVNNTNEAADEKNAALNNLYAKFIDAKKVEDQAPSDLPDNSYRGQHVKIPIIGLGVSFLPTQSPTEILK